MLGSINPASSEQDKVVSSTSAEKVKSQSDSNTDVNWNPLLIAYMELLNAVQNNRDSTILQSKQLQENGKRQQSINNREAKLTLKDLPQKEFSRVCIGYTAPHRHVTVWGANAKVYYTEGKAIYTNAVVNMPAIMKAKGENANIDLQRRYCEEEENRSGMAGQKIGAQTSAQCEMGEQTITMASSLLQILSRLSEKACMKTNSG